MTEISTHVLDTARGFPAAGIPVALQSRDGDGWVAVATSHTDADGRAAGLGGTDGVGPGVHRLVFETAEYLEAPAFFPEVVVAFTVADEPRLHLPLLLSPYSYATYRGS